VHACAARRGIVSEVCQRTVDIALGMIQLARESRAPCVLACCTSFGDTLAHISYFSQPPRSRLAQAVSFARKLLRSGVTPQQAALALVDECLATDRITPASFDNITGSSGCLTWYVASCMLAWACSADDTWLGPLRHPWLTHPCTICSPPWPAMIVVFSPAQDLAPSGNGTSSAAGTNRSGGQQGSARRQL
jgi:hypothetical protein